MEEDETFRVSLSVSDAPEELPVGGPATGTIEDDDSAVGASAGVTISNASATEGDSMTFTVTLHRAVPGGLTVTPRFTDVTAAANRDYTPNTAALRFHRHGRRAADLHGGDHRGCGGGRRRDVHGAPRHDRCAGGSDGRPARDRNHH